MLFPGRRSAKGRGCWNRTSQTSSVWLEMACLVRRVDCWGNFNLQSNNLCDPKDNTERVEKEIKWSHREMEIYTELLWICHRNKQVTEWLPLGASTVYFNLLCEVTAHLGVVGFLHMGISVSSVSPVKDPHFTIFIFQVVLLWGGEPKETGQGGESLGHWGHCTEGDPGSWPLPLACSCFLAGR